MRTGSTLTTLLRFVFAVLFGVVSILPVPLRALAHPGAIPHTHAATVPDSTHHAAHSTKGYHSHVAAGHDHGAVVRADDDEQGAPQPLDGAALCHSAPCCTAVTQCPPSAPASILHLLGQLAVPPAQVIVAVTPDPVVPPPRLQA